MLSKTCRPGTPQNPVASAPRRTISFAKSRATTNTLKPLQLQRFQKSAFNSFAPIRNYVIQRLPTPWLYAYPRKTFDYLERSRSKPQGTTSRTPPVPASRIDESLRDNPVATSRWTAGGNFDELPRPTFRAAEEARAEPRPPDLEARSIVRHGSQDGFRGSAGARCEEPS